MKDVFGEVIGSRMREEAEERCTLSVYAHTLTHTHTQTYTYTFTCICCTSINPFILSLSVFLSVLPVSVLFLLSFFSFSFPPLSFTLSLSFLQRFPLSNFPLSYLIYYTTEKKKTPINHSQTMR